MNESDKSQPRWLTIGQASKYLGISRDTLRRWEKAGKIKAVRSPTNRRYYTQKQLDQIMEGKTQTTASSTKPKSNPAINRQVKLFLIGLLSCAAAAAFAFLIQLLVFR